MIREVPNCDTIEVEQQVIEFFQSRGNISRPLDAETDLLAASMLDSMTLMDLVMFLEQRYDVRIDGRDMSPEQFRTVGRIHDLIESKLARRSNAQPDPA